VPTCTLTMPFAISSEPDNRTPQRPGDGTPEAVEDWDHLEALQARLGSTSSRRKRGRLVDLAAVPLGTSGEPRALAFLAELVRDPASSRRVNRAAVHGLKEAGPAAAPHLRELLKDGVADPGVAWPLGEAGSPEDVPLLLPLLQRKGLRLRYNTLSALDELDGPGALDGFHLALSDRRLFVREKAFVALRKRCADPEVIEAIQAARKRVPWYRLVTHRMYQQWTHRLSVARR
jgi:HEAT repeat protein